MLGLPVALIIAWAFEAHPEGVRRTQPSARPPPRFRAMDWVLVAATLAIVGVFTVQATGLWSPPWRKGGDKPPAAAAAEKSIAVLPFANFSGSKDAEYFADGLTEEVINSLAKTPDLKVAGRTSAFYYKDKNTDLRQVGRQLGVAHVLEGSIRREGERIRVTAQLIKVSDGFHMWSETYDRDLKDAFAVQTEIADNVAGVLKTKLLSSPQSAGDADAYRLIVTARGRMRDLGQANLQAARSLFQRAIKLDSDNPDAHAGLAQATMMLAQNHLALDFDRARRESQTAVATALRLDPNNVQAHLAQGHLNRILALRTSDARYTEVALAAYRRAYQLAPGNADVLTFYGSALNGEGRAREAAPILKQALEVDPLNRVALISSAGAQARLGRTDEAVQAYRAVINLYPEFVEAQEDLGTLLAERGRLDEAEPWLRRAAASMEDPSAAIRLAHLYANLGLPDDARRVTGSIRQPPIAVGAARVVTFLLDRDWPGLLAYAQAQKARDSDPFYANAVLLGALMTGDDRLFIQGVREVSPALLGPDPPVSELDLALKTSHALNRLGLRDQAARILNKILVETAPKAGEYQPGLTRVRRAQAFSELGERAKALAELRGAAAQGYRFFIDFEDFVRLEDDPNFASLRGDAEFRAIIAQIVADNARMRARVLAARTPRQAA
jgi:TolB-like protein/Tfp pilus assembly protein PilF